MNVEKFKSEGISQLSYLVSSGNEAAVIDPRRDCQAYLDAARRGGLKIRYIFETHRNEDFVVGSIELGKLTGAEIYHGPGLDWKYGNTLKDGQTFKIGKIILTALLTPGHTDESMCYTLADMGTGQAVVGVFTGDTLFVNEVGRADLYGASETPRMASNLYDSIFGKLFSLGDGVIIYPAHGGGSVCGAHIADRESSTIGIEKAQNPVLKLKTKEDFIKFKVGEKLERPFYFRQMEKYNLEGPLILPRLPAPVPLTSAEFKAAAEQGALVIDTREPSSFGGLHIKGAYNIWVDGLPAFSGWILPYDKPLLLVLEDPNYLEKAVSFLYRAGYDNITGYLRGGMDDWSNTGMPMQSLSMLPVHELKQAIDSHEDLFLLDSRSEMEWEAGHIDNAYHIFVGFIDKRLAEIPKEKPVAVYCSTGHRSSIAVSILLRAGYKHVLNVPGSITAWKAAGFPVVKS